MNCKNCGVKITKLGEMWIDNSLVFPQYCSGKGASLHAPIDCGYACGYVEPYGFIPECGCPVHDPEPMPRYEEIQLSELQALSPTLARGLTKRAADLNSGDVNGQSNTN